MLFENANEFSQHIETLANSKKMGLVDTIVMYCEDNYIKPNEISKLINKSLKDKLEMEFQEMNFLPKTSTLDF